MNTPKSDETLNLFCEKLIGQKLVYSDIRAKVLAECDSTNTYLFHQIKDTNIHGKAVIAQNQTQGKGRQGKTWIASNGECLPLSLGWQFPTRTPQLTALPLVIALTTWQVLTALGVPAQIKWPNDIVIEQAKLAGILVESLQSATGIITVSGIGINLKAPKIQEQATFGVWDYAPACNPNYLASFLLLALNQSLNKFQEQGFTPFKKSYLNACRDMNHPVILWHNGQILAQGTMEAVDDTGALILKTPEGSKHFTIGQVSLRTGKRP